MADKKKTDWSGERDVYVTGTESLADIAKRLGVSKTAVEKHACNREVNGGRTWGEWREEFRSEISGEKTEIVKRIKVEAAAVVSMQHATLLADLAQQSREAVANVFAQLEPKEKVKLALAIVVAERRIHGLDRAAVQVEVTGKDGKPIEHDVTLDFDNDADARDLAERALQAVFGETADQAGAATTS